MMEDLNLQTLSFEEICRFCVSNAKTTELFSSTLDGLKYYEIAQSLSDIPILKNDIYPKGLCDNCAQKLIYIQEFKLLIKNAYIDFDKLLMNEEILENGAIEFVIPDDDMEDYKTEYNGNNVLELSDFDKYNGSTLEIESNEAYNFPEKRDSELEISKKKIRGLSKLTSTIITSNILPPDEQDKWHKKLSGWIKKQESQNSLEDKANKVRPYGCEICGNSYTTIFSLRDHTHVHSGEMNFHCDFCGKRFGTKKNLKTHMKYRHSKCEMFYCEICGFAFNRRSNLNSHKWVHSETKRYSCIYCGKCFKWKNGFDIHVNSHLKTKTYDCYMCNKVFYTLVAQIKHCRRYHDGLGRVPLEQNDNVNLLTGEEVISTIENEDEMFILSDVNEIKDEFGPYEL